MSWMNPELKDKKDDDAVVEEMEEEEEEKGPVFDQVPVKVVCEHCGLSVITYIEHESSWVTYTVSIVILFVLGWAAVCVLPIVFPLFKDVVHHCPRCLSVLATRSRVAITNFRGEVMSFRFGSCVVVLARKYVLLLVILVALVGGISMARSSTGAAAAGMVVARGPESALSWEDFKADCGFKSYLGNPIHVTKAFNDKYRNRTFHWEGALPVRSEAGFSILGWRQQGMLFARMSRPQFENKPNWPDLLLLFDPSSPVNDKVTKLKKGNAFAFSATMVEVGRRGDPHTMHLWDLSKPGTNATTPEP